MTFIVAKTGMMW